MPTATNCLLCGKTFMARPAKLRYGISTFCSRACRGLSQRAKPVKSCAICNKEFRHAASRTKASCCSVACGAKKKQIDITSRFWARVIKGDDGACWRWNAPRHNFGYGTLSKDRTLVSAHRFSWELHFGQIPQGMLVCHGCDNPECTNPEHLFLGTHKDNVQDMIQKRRNVTTPGEKNGTSKLTESDVREIRDMVARGATNTDALADAFSVSRTCINHVIRRSTWAHI